MSSPTSAFTRRATFVEALLQGAAAQEVLDPGDRSDLRICGVPSLPGVLYAELDRTCPGTDGWVTVDVRGGLGINPWLDVVAAVSNLFDRRYRLHGSGIDAPGVSALLALEVKR